MPVSPLYTDAGKEAPEPEEPISPEAWKTRAEAAEHALHSLLAELGHPTADQRRIPVQRADHDVLVTQQTLLEDILLELRRANSTAREGAVSSIQIEDNPTKDRVVRITTKHYAGSVLDVDEALAAHGYAHRRAEELALNGWADTLQAEQAKREVA